MNPLNEIKNMGLDVFITDAGKIRLRGLAGLEPEKAQRVVVLARDHKSEIIKALSENGGLFSGANLDIEPMTTCLHGKRCPDLYSRRGDRPGCFVNMGQIFDLDRCPLGLWVMHYDKGVAI